MRTLQPNTTLQGGKYIIKKVLGQGGFGITYLAEHDLLGTNVAIKEFFIKDFCNRDSDTSQVIVGTDGAREQVACFKEKFLKEARNIAKLHHSNIVRISDVFEENGTAYYVMDYCQGGSLADLIKQNPSRIDENLALKYIRQIASALSCVHEHKMMHMDVKPANIMLDAKGDAILIDFGISKNYSDGTTSLVIGASAGYSPIEQYTGIKEFSPQSDIYSLGATFYTLITGQTPPNPQEIDEHGVPMLSTSSPIISAIHAAMQYKRINRPESIAEWLKILDNGKIELDEDTNRLIDTENEAQERYRKKKNTTPQKKTFGSKRSSQGRIWKYPKKIITGIVICIIVLIIGVIAYPLVLNKNGLITNKKNGHEYVDLGLSVKWATCNIGADFPSDNGYYYAWSETNAKSKFDWDNCLDCYDSSNFHKDWAWGTYKNGGQTVIVPTSGNDVAREEWGGTWRLPLEAEMEELVKQCTWTWMATKNGHRGYQITGPNGNSIFLPADGYRDGTSSYGVGWEGRYWTSIISQDNIIYARSLYFNDSEHKIRNDYRKRGFSVRPVTE